MVPHRRPLCGNRHSTNQRTSRETKRRSHHQIWRQRGHQAAGERYCVHHAQPWLTPTTYILNKTKYVLHSIFSDIKKKKEDKFDCTTKLSQSAGAASVIS